MPTYRFEKDRVKAEEYAHAYGWEGDGPTFQDWLRGNLHGHGPLTSQEKQLRCDAARPVEVHAGPPPYM